MNKITGFFNYKNITTFQHENVAEKFIKLFKKVNPSQILEIGTSFGGFTLLLRDLLDEYGFSHTQLRTYDINKTQDRSTFLNHIDNGINIDFRLKDLFDYMNYMLVEVEEAKEYIQQSGTTIVLCDGNNKINEVKSFAPILKINDILMAHDYAPTEHFFSKNIENKIWNWLEIQDSSIIESLKNNNLEPYMQEEFQEVVWMCRKKII